MANAKRCDRCGGFYINNEKSLDTMVMWSIAWNLKV